MQSSPDPHLNEFQKRCTAVRDLVHHVVTNEDVYGFYLWGPQGCGKSTGIERALNELGKTPILFRGSMTDQSLFREAKAHPHGTLWINDDPELLTKPTAQQYLLAMLEDTTDQEDGNSNRLVTKTRVREEDNESFIFQGKILFDSNMPIASSRGRRTLQAVEDRLVVHHFGPTDAEIAAVLQYLAGLTEDNPDDDYTCIRLNQKDRKYWRQTTPEERSEIVEFIIEQAATYNASLSLRSLRDTLKYYVDQREHGYSTDWRDVVIKELTRYDVEYLYSRPPSRKDARLEAERKELVDILLDAKECAELGASSSKQEAVKSWCEATGQNDRQFRRRLAEVPEHIRSIYDQLHDGRMRPDH